MVLHKVSSVTDIMQPLSPWQWRP